MSVRKLEFSWKKIVLFWYLCYEGRVFWKNNFFLKIKLLVKEIFFRQYDLEISKDTDMKRINALFYIRSTRLDTTQHLKAIYNCYKDNALFVKGSSIFSFTLKNIVSLLVFWKSMKFVKEVELVDFYDDGIVKNIKKKKIPFLGRVHLYVYLSKIKQANLKLRKYYESIKGIVVLSDIWPEENLIMQDIDRTRVTTICCQEGFWYDEPNLHNGSELAFIYPTSDLYLFWGEKTEKLYKKYNNIKSRIVGEPYVRILRNSIDRWCLILDNSTMHIYNQELINIVSQVAKEYHKKVDLRLHPFDRKNIASYEIDLDVFNPTYEEALYEASFCHTSSTLVLVLAMGIPTFQYKTRYSEDKIIDERICFSDINQLQLKMKKLDSIDFKEIVQNDLKFIDKEADKQYREVFAQICDP